MIVVDASAWLELLGTDVGNALGHAQLVVPEHFDAEVLHGLRGLVRGGRFTREEGAYWVESLGEAPLLRMPVVPLLQPAWSLAEAVSADDALYVALARREGAPLVTTDAPGPRRRRPLRDPAALTPAGRGR